jgi:CHAT domain
MGDVVFGDKHGGDNTAGNKYVFSGGMQPAASVPSKVILLMSANADPHQPLRLDEERRAIDRAVADSRAAGRLELRTSDALRLDDLQYALLRHRPAIVHFSGHGHRQDGIQAVDASGRAQSVLPKALSELFRILSAGLQCVVLNACYTEDQARAIAAHVPCVVGMRRQVRDDTAVLFATGFYRGVANEQSIRASFDLALNSLDLHDVPDADVPQLIARGIDADRPVIGAA